MCSTRRSPESWPDVGFYGYYSQIGQLPATSDPTVYGLGETANPAHTRTGPVGYRPDYMPLVDPDGLPYPSAAFDLSWEEDCGAPGEQSPYEHATALFGAADRDRDTVRSARDIHMPSWRAHQVTGYPQQVSQGAAGYVIQGGPEQILSQVRSPLDYDDEWTVERRDEEVTPTERGWAGGGNFVPGNNSLTANNAPLDRWDREAPPIDDFGEPLRQGVDVVVTIERDMVQPTPGNLADGNLPYSHPMLDNIAAVPQAPSQWPDRAMEPVDPYQPGGGMYSDWQREVISDVSTPQVEQQWDDDSPSSEGTPAYDGEWE